MSICKVEVEVEVEVPVSVAVSVSGDQGWFLGTIGYGDGGCVWWECESRGRCMSVALDERENAARPSRASSFQLRAVDSENKRVRGGFDPDSG